MNVFKIGNITTIGLALILGACSVAPNTAKVKEDKEGKLAVDDTTIAAPEGDSVVTPGGGGNTDQSFELFKTTVHEVAKNCAGCHAEATAPKFANEDPVKAFEVVLNSNKVNFQDPEASRLYLRLAEDQHNCWTSCETDAATMLAAIEQWAEEVNNTDQDASSFNFVSDPLTFAEAADIAKLNPMSDGVWAFEVEDFTINAPYEIVEETGASGGSVVTATTGTAVGPPAAAQDANTDLGTIEITFDVDQTFNAYRIYLYANVPDGNSDTVFVKMDDQPSFAWTLGQSGANYQWNTVRNSEDAPGQDFNFQLFKGTHTLTLRQADLNMKIDKIIIARAIVPDLDAVEVTSTKQVNFLWDLSGLLGGEDVQLSIKIEDFDANAYLFKSPTLIVDSDKCVSIKGLYPIVNDSYLSQHAAYAVVKTTTQKDEEFTELATNSTTILKDEDATTDKITIGFDDLSMVDCP